MHFQFNQSEAFEDLAKMADRFGKCVKEAMDDPELAEKFRRFGAQFETGSPFDKGGHRGPKPQAPKGPSGYAPRMNRFHDAQGSLVFEFLLPGFELSGVDLRFREDTMYLSAILPQGFTEQSGRRYASQGFSLSDFERLEYAVPADDYEQGMAKAVMRNGVLTIRIPAKDPADDPNSIKIEIVKEGN